MVAVLRQPTSTLFQTPRRLSHKYASRYRTRHRRTVIRVKGKGLMASRLKSRSSYRVLVLPGWALTMLRARRVRLGAFDGPVFPDTKGGYRDRNNVGTIDT